jgi:hypothetical protein
VFVDKALAWHAREPQAGKPAQLAAGAYTNSFKGPLGLTPPMSAVLDIQNTGGLNKNVGLMIADGVLYEINIETGNATKKGAIKGLPKNLQDIAVR